MADRLPEVRPDGVDRSATGLQELVDAKGEEAVQADQPPGALLAAPAGLPARIAGRSPASVALGADHEPVEPGGDGALLTAEVAQGGRRGVAARTEGFADRSARG